LLQHFVRQGVYLACGVLPVLVILAQSVINDGLRHGLAAGAAGCGAMVIQSDWKIDSGGNRQSAVKTLWLLLVWLGIHYRILI
jgi:hypothetical protein